MNNESRLYGIIMLVLSLWVMVQLVLEILLELPPAAMTFLSILDAVICTLFLADWVYFLIRAGDKPAYFKNRFFDLIASIPFLSFLRPLRVLRIVRILRAFRLLRGLRGMGTIVKSLAGNPARSALSLYLAATSLIYFYCSLGMYSYERGMNPKLNGFSDALWMAFTTMTTIGYGDIYPTTTGGRLLAAVLVLTGMGLFSLLTAEVAALLLKRTRKHTETVGRGISSAAGREEQQ